MSPAGQPVYRRLSETLVLRTVQSEADIQRYIAFNAQFNNPFEGAASACLLNHHPDTTYDNFWIIEDERSQQIVSTTCLIPWKFYFNGLDLSVAQLEMVLTHPDYRGQGLVRAQIEAFHQAVSDRSLDMCIIWGIPYFYRQFGYTYAIDGDIAEITRPVQIPDSLDSQDHYHLRPATTADIPLLNMNYELVVKDLDVYAARSERYWDYLLHAAQHPVEMVEDQQSPQPGGYLIIQRTTDRVKVLENALPNPAAALAVLQMLKSQQPGELEISWPASTPLVQTARLLGSQTRRGGQWLVRIPDLTHWLTRLTPALNTRLAEAGWKDLTTRLVINLYRQAFALHIHNGALQKISSLGFIDASMGADGGELCIPPDAFVRLALGYRKLDKLADAWPDIIVKPQVRELVETLFPALRSYLYLPYHFLGAV